jgi:hypothetical protein
MTRITVAPSSPGLLVPIPGTRQYLPAEGLEVERDTFWNRRLALGEVVEITADASKSQPESEA